MAEHVRYSPSGADGWMLCPQWASDGKGNKFADEGTVAHHIAAQCLLNGHDADVHTGEVYTDLSGIGIESTVHVTQDMVEHVQAYVDQVRAAAHDGELQVEQKVDYSAVAGIPDQFGTADAVILRPGRFDIRDLKFGRGVKVSAEGNRQLQIYALGKLYELEDLGFEFDEVCIAIHQPRLDHLDEWVVPVSELKAFGEEVRAAIAVVNSENPPYNPGEKQCRWCARKAECPALARRVVDEIGVEFEDLTLADAPPAVPSDAVTLAEKMAALDLIEDWCKAIRAAVETNLLSGVEVPGYKLVEGKKGARSWADEESVRALFQKFRLKSDEMYEYKLISPTKAEKLLKDSPRRWAQVEGLISQTSGKPSVAPASDKRPALNVADGFGTLVEG